MKLHIYLNYDGNCAEAFRFYEKHLGGKIIMMSTFGEMPDSSNIPDDQKNHVLHARIEIGDSVIMASDMPPGRHKPMRSAYLSLSVGSNEEAEKIYDLLKDGGEVFMPMQETFFAQRYAALRDKFGTSWMINCERPAQSQPS